MRGNTFANCGTCACRGASVVRAAPALADASRRTEAFHGTVRVTGNRFEGLRAAAVHAEWVREVIVDDNDYGGADESGWR